MKGTHRIPAIALADGAALEIVDTQFRIISSLKGANAFKCYWSGGTYRSEQLEQSARLPLELLYARRQHGSL